MTVELFREDAYLSACEARVVACEPGAIVLDRTVFYPAGGGQAGDTGVLRTSDGTPITVRDTTRSPDGRLLHLLAPDAAAPPPGTALTACIDWSRRHRLMRLHTAMHLLCAIVPAPVTGGAITPEKAHLDFDIDMERLDKAAIEHALNDLVTAGHPTAQRWITEQELAAQPDLVRTMSVKPPAGSGRVRLLEIAGVDLQPCGGTHVRNTAEIGACQVLRIRSEGRRNRRVSVGLVETAPHPEAAA